MADNLNVNDNMQECRDIVEGFREDSGKDRMPYEEEITVMKTEVKEEYCDFEMSVEDIEFLNVKEEYISSPENNIEKDLELRKSIKHLLNENVDTGNCETPALEQSCEHHTLKHTKESPKYTCSICQHATHIEKDLLRHISNHTNDRPFKCTYKDCKCTLDQKKLCECNTCGYATIRKHNLNKHILTKHSKVPKKYICSICQYGTNIKGHLVDHKRIHSSDRPFKCTYKNCKCTPEQKKSCKCNMCGFTTKHNGGLNKHIFLRHSGQPKKYKCTHCNYATHSKSHLPAHISIHTNEKSFKCTYKNCKCTLEQEVLCKCNPCGYASRLKYNFEMHILTKHSKMPKKYNCNICQYATHMRASLVNHVRIHSNDRPFKCTYKNCKCSIVRKYFNETCECNTCGYAAKRKSGLDRHILMKHSEEPKKYVRVMLVI